MNTTLTEILLDTNNLSYDTDERPECYSLEIPIIRSKHNKT